MSIVQLLDRRLQDYPALHTRALEHGEKLVRALGLTGMGALSVVTANAPPVSGGGWIAAFGICTGIGIAGIMYETRQLSRAGEEFGENVEVKALMQPTNGEFIT